MKYNIELASPDMEVMIENMCARLTALSMLQHENSRMYGRTATLTLAVTREIWAVQRCITVLNQAVLDAKPEHAIGVPDDQQTAIQVGGDMKLVGGRPRNDPRYVKPKIR